MARARSKTWRFALLVVLIMLLILMLSRLRTSAGEADLLVYWSASRLLATGGNPFDQTQLQALQNWTRPGSVNPLQAWAAWNPPWLLLVLLPFSLLPFDWAVRVWELCSLGLILAACAWTWRWVADPADRLGLVIVLVSALAFGQTLSCLSSGQIGGLLLFGLVLGLWCLQTGHDHWAGAALLLTTIKPHIAYFVLWLVLLWVIRRRRWKVAVGLLGSALACMLVLWLIFPGWSSAYVRLLSGNTNVVFGMSAATIGGLAYALWGTHVLRFAGVLLLPLTGVVLPLVDSLGWLTTMNIALLMSVPLAPYGFNFDQVVLLPTIVQMIAWMRRGELTRNWTWGIASGLLLMNAVLLRMLTRRFFYNYWLAWVPLVLAALYALAWKQRHLATGQRALAVQEQGE